MKRMYQQGDVILIRSDVTVLKEDCKVLKHTRLAEGEATGHYHEAVGEDVELIVVGDTWYLSAPNGAEVTHQEHDTITVPPGTYERRIVQEYDHFTEEARDVVD